VLHRPSIWWFKHPDRPWFVREDATRTAELTDGSPGAVRHLSSSATCLESLHDPLATEDEEYADTVASFANIALTHSDDQTWSSEQAARVYCRVRTLTPILALAPPKVIRRHLAVIKKLVRDVWTPVDPWMVDRQGVAEASEDADGRFAYPPNAFHTYWAIRMLQEWTRQPALTAVPPSIQRKRAVAQLWARQVLAAQTALIRSEASRVDAHQLAWALSTEFLGTEAMPVTAATPRLELYRAALDAYFSAQLSSGGWPLYEPLFHYPAAGNAYCYTFETLAILLRPALHDAGGQTLRTLLRPHLPNLLEAAEFAKRTRMELNVGVVGWCSGHHPHRTSAEAWATASVFSYLEKLRCLVGYWTREEAARHRRARQPRKLGSDAAELLAERGDLWTETDGWSPARQLAAMFVHPSNARICKPDWIDPDRPLILKDIDDDGSDQARSSILFGPPGTGKTTLVEAVAGAIDWRFVEVLASDFLSEGMDRVPAKADEIFDQLMELDRCVILFDEIDELIRSRNDEADPFGRFLTTSMLPKLAQLWEQRRVLFFVATNDVDAADAAIKRTQRFDARIFAAPPAFHVKRRLLAKILTKHGRRFPSALKEEAVRRALSGSYEEGESFGVFALLRHDQMYELANLMIKETGEKEMVSASTTKAALDGMGKRLKAVEWEHDELDPYGLYRHHRQNESYDHRMMRWACVPAAQGLPPLLKHVVKIDSQHSYARLASTFIPSMGSDGEWKVDINGQPHSDKRRLDFTRNEGGSSSDGP
jgi:ATPase family protein associated with various cellular activities (AAA)